jgi:stearoyl-CoA desaturase (Delta-9 desaturase)
LVVDMTFLFAALVALTAIAAVRSRLPYVVFRSIITAGIFLPILATGYAIWRLWGEMIGARELALFLCFYVAGGLGATVGFHRLLTHRSFETRPSVKATLLILGSMTAQGGCIDWAAHHAKHHAYSDREGDPHSPREGFLHAHFGWIMRGPPAERERYCKRLLDDPLVSFIDRTTAVWLVLGLAIPYLVAGWEGLLWGGLVRIALFNQVSFSVNSIGHRFGSRPFETKDESRNNSVLAVLSFGDGWHNNHHAFPSMAYHGMTWRQVDGAALVIRLLAAVGLAWDVKQPPPALVQKRRRHLVPAEADR